MTESQMLNLFEKENEPRHDKTNKVPVRPAKTQSACASAQSDQSLHCGLNG